MKKYLEPAINIISFDASDIVSFGDGVSVPFIIPHGMDGEDDDLWNEDGSKDGY